MGLVMAGVLFVAGMALFAVGIVVLALGARLFADAAAAVHRSRSHGLSADEQQRIGAEAHDALEELDRRRARAPLPDVGDDELAEAIVAQREEVPDDDGGDVPSAFLGGIYAKGS